MTIQKRIPLTHSTVFPNGAYLKGGVEPVLDFTPPSDRTASGPRRSRRSPDCRCGRRRCSTPIRTPLSATRQ